MNIYCLLFVIFGLASLPHKIMVSGGGGALEDRPSSLSHHQHHSLYHHHPSPGGSGGGIFSSLSTGAVTAGSGHLDHHRNSYNLLSEAMSQAVSHEFSSLGSGSADGACQADDLDCYSGNIQDRLGMEAIRSLHRQLDDDDNGNIDLSESDDFLREELKYDSGYEKRQKAFHFNDDMHISVKELWEAWLRSEVHNWTIEQTTDWLAQSVQLPQYVELFKQHKVTGAALPRLAVNNMHYVSNVLGIKDPIHKQKIALKAMDVVLFGPPRETGTRWKDYILVTLLLSAIIGCWYAYQQNKNAKRHLRRMAQDMEGLQKAEQALQEMQKELELARMEQENVATEKLDLERRLKEAPSLSSSNSDLELQQLKQEIEMLRSELSRAEVELVDHCWSPPPQLQTWLQYTYEIESRHHLRKRLSAEKQLQSAREACEKLRKKRSSLVGAFVSTHGKSIDDVDRSIVEARNSLSEVTNELQERLHRWKQVELMTGFSIVNNNGLTYLENVLYSNRNGGSGGGSITGKSSRGRITNSTDDLDDDSVQGRNIGIGGGPDDSSVSEDGDNQSVQFYLGNNPSAQNINHLSSAPSLTNLNTLPTSASSMVGVVGTGGGSSNISHNHNQNISHNHNCSGGINKSNIVNHNSHPVFNSHDSVSEENRSPSVSSERSMPIPPRNKKPLILANTNSMTVGSAAAIGIPPPPPLMPLGRTPLPPPRRTNAHQSQFIRSQSSDTVPLEYYYSINQGFKTPSNVTGSGNLIQPTTIAFSIGQYQLPTSASISANTPISTIFPSSSTTGFSTPTSPMSNSNINFDNNFTNPNTTTTTTTTQHGITSKYNNNTNLITTTTTTFTPTIGFTSNTNDTINGITTTVGTGNTGSIGSTSTGTIKDMSTTPQHSFIKSSAYSDTQIEDTVSSTDSSSISDDIKKQKRRKLRLPFGKKSNKNKLA